MIRVNAWSAHSSLTTTMTNGAPLEPRRPTPADVFSGRQGKSHRVPPARPTRAQRARAQAAKAAWAEAQSVLAEIEQSYARTARRREQAAEGYALAVRYGLIDP